MGRNALALGVAAALITPCVPATVLPSNTSGTITPTCGGAFVDGSSADWNLGVDEVVNMYRAGNATQDLLSKVYWRYDSSTTTAYVLVLAESDHKLMRKDAWVKIYDNAQSTVNFTHFEWVTNGVDTIGYEASFQLPPGAYGEVEVHAQIVNGTEAGDTSSTGTKQLSTWGLKALGCVGIGNRVWQEVNGTPGYQPGVDLPIAGVTVEVHNQNYDYIDDAKTDANGCYVVEGLTSGKPYYAAILSEDLPSGLVPVARSYPAGYKTDGLAGSGFTNDDRASTTQVPGSAVADQDGLQDFAFGDVTSNWVTVDAGVAPAGEEEGRTEGSCALVPMLPDNSVNETIDFAFEAAVGIGNRVWIEKNGRPGFQGAGHPDVANGLVADEPRESVSVQLLKPAEASGADPTLIGEDTTDAQGCYLIERSTAGGLIPDGEYFVRIPQANFDPNGPLAGAQVFNSYTDDMTVDDGGSTVTISGADYDAGDQNGRPGNALGAVISQAYPLVHGTAPTTLMADGITVVAGSGGTPCDKDDTNNILPPNSVNVTADFAFDEKVAIGNLVWIEKNGTPGFQGTGTDHDLGVEGVSVVLHSNSDPNFSKTFKTVAGGFYLLDQLTPGSYYLEVPASEFETGKPLAGYEPMALAGADDGNDDAPGNGFPADHNARVPTGEITPETKGVVTNDFDLTAQAEPTGETGAMSSDPLLQSSLPDASVDLTADLAFVKTIPDPQELAGVGSTLWIDVNWNGVQDLYRYRDPVTTVVAEIAEPVIKGCQVRVYGPLGDPDAAENLTNSNDNGIYYLGGLLPGQYEVSVPEGTSGISCVTDQLKAFYTGLNPGLPATLAVLPATTAHLTWAGEPSVPADDQIDGDNNGLQTAPGTRVYSPTITLTAGPTANEPVDDPSAAAGTPNAERTFANDSVGLSKDNGFDISGDMTLDFGFIHQCAAICDMNGDGKVTNWRSTHASGTFNTANCYKKDPVTGKTVGVPEADLVANNVSDTDIIRCLNLTDRYWASTSGKGPGAGKPGSGDCDANGLNSGSDAIWCDVLVQPAP